MISSITLVLVSLTAVYAQNAPAEPYPYLGVQKSSAVVRQANVAPVSPTPKYYNAPQPSPYVAGSAAPQATPYVAVSSVPQPSPYIAVSSAQQPAQYVAVSSAPQPTPYVAVSPKFLSAPVPAAAAIPAVPVSPVVAVPKYAPSIQVRSGIADKDAQIVSEGREVGYDGSFNYGFDTENGISVKSKGYIKPAASPTDEPIQVIEGSYTYFDVYGKPQTIQYIADENGYRAFGDAIPQPPEEILKTLAHRR